MSLVPQITRGDSPLLLAFPHTGTEIPPAILATLNRTGQALADTDWHIHDLYAGLAPDATTVRTSIHRYVIDVNRDPGGHSLYPGQNTTALCPLTDFDGAPLYVDAAHPTADDVAQRCAAYHAPYHAALRAELSRIRAQHGFAILYDCHSIRSQIPFLFDGRLPDFNIGSNQGASSAPEIVEIIHQACLSAERYSTVLDGRFKGGWTTRHYGRPAEHIHAIQMELAQSTYMTEAPPWTWNPDRAARLRKVLGPILTTLTDWRPA